VGYEVDYDRGDYGDGKVEAWADARRRWAAWWWWMMVVMIVTMDDGWWWAIFIVGEKVAF